MEYDSKLAQERSLRLKQLIIHLKMSRKEFAHSLGYDRPETIYRVINGETSLSIIVVDLIRNEYPNINMMWLLYGEGDIVNNEDALINTINILQRKNKIMEEIIKNYERKHERKDQNDITAFQYQSGGVR